jgi:predicted MFS family arabinose efflux permease
MHDITRDFLVSLAAFATVFGIIYVFLITRYRERMSMMEKGIDPSFFTSKQNTTSNTLKLGMLSVGIALGILIASLLYKNNLLDKTPAYFAMTFLFGGLSLILNFIINRRLKD